MCRWADNTKMDLKESGLEWESVDCIDLAQDGGQWWDHFDSMFNFRFYKRE
jgi:hypothetical protein